MKVSTTRDFAMLCAVFAAGLVSAQEVDPARQPAQPLVTEPEVGDDSDAEVRPTRASAEIASKAREELIDLERRRRSLEQRILTERQAALRRLEDLAFEKTTASRAVQSFKKEVERLEMELGVKKERESKDSREASRLAGESQGLLEPMRQFLDRLERHVDESIPWQKDARKAIVQKLRELLEKDDLEPAAALAALTRVQEQEEALGRFVEPGMVEADFRGERRALPAFRLGLIGIAFTNDDLSQAGFVTRGQKVEEALNAAAEEDRRLLRGYLAALEILWGRESPRIVDVFVPSLPMAMEEGR